MLNLQLESSVSHYHKTACMLKVKRMLKYFAELVPECMKGAKEEFLSSSPSSDIEVFGKLFTFSSLVSQAVQWG